MLFQNYQKLWIGVFFITVIAFGFYLFNPYPLYFLNDDLIHIPLSKQGLLFQRNSFRPLGDLSLKIDYFIWQKNAAGYHLTNLLLHIGNSTLVFFLSNVLLKKYSAKKNNFQSCAAAVLFFIYAFHSESVYWIIGRSASLGALFCIPAIIFYVRRSEHVFYFILAALFFVIGLFAYESIWVFPLFAVCISIADKKVPKKKRINEIGYIGIITFLFVVHLIIKKRLLGEYAGQYEAVEFIHFNAVGIAENMLKLLARCFIPPVNNHILFSVLAMVVLLFLLFVYVVAIKKIKSQVILLIFILFLVSFLPYLSLGINTHTLEGERYEYLPSVFASLLLVQIICSMAGKRITQCVALSVLFAYHLFYLKASNKCYTIASSIAKKTFAEINNLRGRETLYIDSLPIEYNGALIFRAGFNEGVNWLKEPGTVNRIVIHSKKINNNNWDKNWQVSNTKTSGTLDSLSLNDTKLKPQDVRFIFDDKELNVIK